MDTLGPLPTGTSVEQLQQLTQLQHAQLKHALAIIERQSAELDRLRGTTGELQLRLAELEASTSEPSGSNSKRKGKSKGSRKPRSTFGPTAQPKLDLVTERFELDDADRMCPQCGAELQPMDGQTESSEMVDVVEIRYVLKKVERQKYSCRCGGCVETAPGPERAIYGGRYSLDFALKVATDKYLDHLPLDRQCRIMKRHGLDVTSQTLWQQLFAVARELAPHHDALRKHILSQHVVGLDQTSWPNLGKGRPKPWQMWALTSTDAIYHAIRGDKAVVTFQDLVGDFDGVIVADCLSTHLSAEKQSRERAGPDGAFTHAACWAHILRRFRDAEPDFANAAEMMAMIEELYAIDAKAESDAERARLRATESDAVLERMHKWLGALRVPSQLSLGSAAKHTLDHWGRLKVFLTDPRVWLDNNRTERALRGPVVGRRNHFGSKSQSGTEVAAVFYSLMESAKLNGVEPTAYLAEAVRISRLTDGRELLMPWEFSAESDCAAA